jgi:hypothetical protein
LAEEESASGFAADAGLTWKALSFLSLGASIQNAGADVKYAAAKDKLPTTTRYGGRLVIDQQNNLRWNEFFQNRYLLTFEGVKVREESVTGNMGLEIRREFGPDNLTYEASIRAGYIGAIKAPTVGAGFRIGSYVFDYGINFVDALDVAHRFTLTVLFGNKKPKSTPGSNRLSF